MDECKKIISRVMLLGASLSGIVMVLGVGIFLLHSGYKMPGDHVFHGEPSALRRPLEIIVTAWKGSDLSFIQLGVLILLLNPLIRVACVWVGYALDKNMLYLIFSSIILCILGISFFV